MKSSAVVSARDSLGGATVALPEARILAASTSLALLYATAAMTTAICWALVVRSTERLEAPHLWAIGLGAPAALALAGAARLLIAELCSSIGPRERAAMFFAHVAFFAWPVFDPRPDSVFGGYFIHCFLSVQIPIVALLWNQQGFARLFAVQALAMLLAGLTDPRDDLWSLAGSVSFAALLALGSFLSRAAFSAEARGLSAPMSLARMARGVRFAWLGMALATLAACWQLPGKDYNARPTLQLAVPRGAPPAAGEAAAAGERLWELARNGFLIALGAGLALWSLDRLKRFLTRRRGGAEMDLGYMAAEVEIGQEPPPALARRRKMGEARARVIDAYADFLRRTADRLAGGSLGSRTARERQDAFFDKTGWRDLESDYAAATEAFEAARYGPEGEGIASADADEFERRLARLSESAETRRKEEKNK